MVKEETQDGDGGRTGGLAEVRQYAATTPRTARCKKRAAPRGMSRLPRSRRWSRALLATGEEQEDEGEQIEDDESDVEITPENLAELKLAVTLWVFCILADGNIIKRMDWRPGGASTVNIKSSGQKQRVIEADRQEASTRFLNTRTRQVDVWPGRVAQCRVDLEAAPPRLPRQPAE